MFEIEPNNSFERANQLNSALTITAQLVGTTDVDYFSFSVNSPGVIRATVTPPPQSQAGSYPGYFYTIYSQDQQPLGSSSGSYSQGFVPAVAIASEAGTYFVKVGYFYSVPGGLYTLRVEVPEPQPVVPTYSISPFYSSVNEGSSATFTLSTTNVAAGTAVAYTISGVSSADVVGGVMSGTVTVGSNSQGTISVPLAADNLTEGTETLTVTAQGKSASVTINDTSTSTAKSDSSSIPQGTYTLNVIVDLFGQVLYLKGLRETVTSTSHTVEHAGTTFNWSEVDSLVTTVTRDGNFTEEFAQEIADAYPSVAGITYATAVSLVGEAAIEGVLIAVAGADGNYVG